MSSEHARIIRKGSRFVFCDNQSTNGSLLDGVAVSETKLTDGDVLELGQTFFLFRASFVMSEAERESVDAADLDAPRGMVSLLPSLASEFANLARVVDTETPVLITGASGTGKEVIARSAHALSNRKGKFVVVDCTALPKDSAENVLFGHKRGAFSGADEDRIGMIETADGGTLFLDEICDLPLESQRVLLRVLQEREVVPIGATSPVPVDFRLLCSTQRDIEQRVARSLFREDLYARIFGFALKLPPLSARLEDMGILLSSLIGELCEQPDSASVSAEAARALLTYHWPRNIRELRTCLQTALALATDHRIELAHLMAPVRKALQQTITGDPLSDSDQGKAPLNEEQKQRRQLLDKLLAEHHGNISAVARSMGKVRSKVQRWIRRYDLHPDSYR